MVLRMGYRQQLVNVSCNLGLRSCLVCGFGICGRERVEQYICLHIYGRKGWLLGLDLLSAWNNRMKLFQFDEMNK